MPLQWKQAITILIVSFIVLNIVMILNLWLRDRPGDQFALSSSQKSEIIESLRQKGVIVEVEIPKEGKPQALLEVALPKLDEKRYYKIFLARTAGQSSLTLKTAGNTPMAMSN